MSAVAQPRSGYPIGPLVPWLIGFLCLSYLVAIPIGYMAYDSLTDGGFTLAAYREFFDDPKLRVAMRNSLLVAAGVAVLSVLVGAPLAFGVARTNMRGKAIVSATMIVSLVSPDFLLAMAYIALAGPNVGYFNLALRRVFDLDIMSGPLNIFTLWGLIFTALPHGVSYVFLTLVPALRNVDPALEEASRVQGAGALQTLRDVTLPLMRPALMSGALLAFAGSLAMYGPPHMLRLNVLTISIRESLIRLDFKGASAASIILILMSLVALVVYRRSTRQAERFRTVGGKSFGGRDTDLGWVGHAFTALGIAYVLAALIVPYGGMLVISLMKSVGLGFSAGNWSFDNYRVVFADPAVRAAAQLSITLAASAATLVAILGFLVAHVVVRSKIPARSLLDYLSIIPLAVPGTALAIALAVIYLNPPLNMLGLYGSFGILFVAYITRFVTFGVRTSQSALIQLSPEFEEASRVAGANGLTTVGFITLPMMRQTFIYTWLLVFVLALPELSASIILKGIHTQTLSTVLLDIWNGNGGLAQACAFGMTMFVSVATILGAAAALSRKAGIRMGG
ncbi:MAG: iron ABC transporter permease [Alphaproteobacteria bacterium]|nr:iron ABC transporter permease [Alphaproteobacteria bacterium]